MDQWTYNYDATKKNRLLSVSDAADATPTFKEDVEGTETFAYDAIGNLTTHTKPSGLTQLAWNAYGKVRQVTQGTTTMTFGYDAQQNRLKKSVTTNGVTKTTYYIRDAQGNALAVYEQTNEQWIWKEQTLYGSSRLGMQKPEKLVTGYLYMDYSQGIYGAQTKIGQKSYELSNHLGNVMVVISDRGVVQSAQDYYPFGMAMPGRSSGAYRYGFNGKETDPETGLNDFGARLYDNRLGRWLAIDPLAAKFPAWSPYVSMNDNPLYFTDPDGMQVDGDYYNTSGKHLGSDGKKDDKVYVADSKQTVDGVDEFVNSKELSMKHSEFLNMAAVAYSETDAHNKKEDMWGIASAIRNRILHKNYGTYTKLKAKEKNYAYVWTDGNDRYKKFSKNGNDAMQLAIAGVINAHTEGAVDYANGGDQWDGVDVITTEKHYTTKCGISDPLVLVPTYISNCKEYFEGILAKTPKHADAQNKLTKINQRCEASFQSSETSINGYQYRVTKVGYTTIFYYHEYEK